MTGFTNEKVPDMDIQLVVFRLSSELFGVRIETVESIVKLQQITHLPHAPEIIRGITNLRGKILPVMDLRMRLGFCAVDNTKNSRIVVINQPSATIGLIVDGVEEVITLPETMIEPAPQIYTSINDDFIDGLVKTDHGLIVLLKPEKVFDLTTQKIMQ